VKKSKINLLIDTDPGVDDALALLVALQIPKIEIKGIISTFGNHTVTQTTRNAIRVLKLAQSFGINRRYENLSIVSGENKPLSSSFTPYLKIHGEDGLGESNLPDTNYPFIEEKVADYINRTVLSKPNKISILCLGPLTNLAKFVLMFPKSCQKVKEVIVSGGAVFYPGNANLLVEANFNFDPDAAEIVFKSPLKITLVPLNITDKFQLEKKDLNKLTNAEFKKVIINIIKIYDQYYRFEKKYFLDPETLEKHRFKGGSIHDVVALFSAILNNAYVGKKTVRCKIVNEGIYRGQLVVYARGEYDNVSARKIDIVESIDKNKLWQEFYRALNKYE